MRRPSLPHLVWSSDRLNDLSPVSYILELTFAILTHLRLWSWLHNYAIRTHALAILLLQPHHNSRSTPSNHNHAPSPLHPRHPRDPLPRVLSPQPHSPRSPRRWANGRRTRLPPVVRLLRAPRRLLLLWHRSDESETCAKGQVDCVE